ncbi:MAG: pilin [gamma proteobacterium symbiont of Lucinoma myriamae]|nr:pilin [gamma proteobacterium symbiont of Lucinoma myriamae]MCU7819797.1 pilin [gamma proteobacterium symbiont of Lucinoma myriamae]
MKRNQQGFTLIELMIVVAIIGILAAVAIPAYKDYIARSQATEASVLLSGLKAPLAEYYQDKGAVATLTDLSAVSSGKYVASVTGAATAIYTATYKSAGIAPQIQGKTMTMAYDTNLGTFTWSCSGLSKAVRPKNCQ